MEKTAVTLPEEKNKEKPEPKLVTFSKKKEPSKCPFKEPETSDKKVKLLIWGEIGTGKTVLSLQFPDPVVIDMEKGTTPFGGQFKFKVNHASDPATVFQNVDWLLRNKHSFQTINLDPITNFWEWIVRSWSDIYLLRRKGGKGHKNEFYDFQPNDWNSPKAEIKSLFRKLAMLEMNIIATAGMKAKYQNMRQIGNTFDSEKTINRFFDTVIRIDINDKGEHICTKEKDRTNKLPDRFKCSCEKDGKTYITAEPFLEAFGEEYLNHKPKPIKFITDDQKGEIESLIKKFGMSDADRDKRLLAYDAETIDDLTEKNAEIILSKLKVADEENSETKKEEGE